MCKQVLFLRGKIPVNINLYINTNFVEFIERGKT